MDKTKLSPRSKASQKKVLFIDKSAAINTQAHYTEKIASKAAHYKYTKAKAKYDITTPRLRQTQSNRHLIILHWVFEFSLFQLWGPKNHTF